MENKELTGRGRIKFIKELTDGLVDKLGYTREEANDIAIKRADNLDPSWRKRWGNDISLQVKQELDLTTPKDDYNKQMTEKKIIPLTENADGKDELDLYINNDEPSYRILQGIVEKGIENKKSKDVVVRLVARKIGEMKDDFNQYGKIYTTADERFEIAKDFVDSLWEDDELTEAKMPCNLTPEKRIAIDGKTWWVPYDEDTKKYSTITVLGKYKTKKDCQDAIDSYKDKYCNKEIKEDTVKLKDGKWANKGKEGMHGTFRTKKAADAQRRAIWVNWDK